MSAFFGKEGLYGIADSGSGDILNAKLYEKTRKGDKVRKCLGKYDSNTAHAKKRQLIYRHKMER